MKKFIEKETGRIVTLLSVDEAKKVLEMYINYCLGKREVKSGRLNLVNYLGDFIKYSSNKDIVRFYDTLVKDKETFGFSKNDLKAYESLVTFFELYNGIEKGEFNIMNVSDYIMSSMSKKETIDKKIQEGQELNFEEKLNHIFFNKDFDLSILAVDACKKWEEVLKRKIGENPDGIDVSLKDEIAYQDLLAFSNGEKLQPLTTTVEIKKENFAEEIKKDQVSKTQSPSLEDVKIEDGGKEKEIPQVSNTSEVMNKKEVDTSKNDESKKEENFGPIILNTVDENKKEEKQQKEEKQDVPEQDEIIIGSSGIREATQDVSLRDAAGFFNRAIDDVSKKDSNNNSNNTSNDSDFFGGYGSLRD